MSGPADSNTHDERSDTTGRPINSRKSPAVPVDKLLTLSKAFLIIAGLHHLFAYGSMGLFAEDVVDRLWEREAAAARAEGLEPDLTGLAEFKAGWMRKTQFIGFGLAAVGIAYLVLGFVMKQQPIVATSVGIPLQIGDWVVWTILYPSKATDIGPIIARIAVLVVLTATFIVILKQRQSRAPDAAVTT